MINPGASGHGENSGLYSDHDGVPLENVKQGNRI